MVKGVNKQIIEVNNPDSIYFEKAVFYLRPGIRMLPVELCQREINKLTEPYSDMRKKAISLRRGRILLCSVIVVLSVLLILSLVM
ncbi:MAG: hypothetical protein IKJ87_07115 [Ruminococcus sp.]|nr:hypothetical protein [Ruminococcus sp.]